MIFGIVLFDYIFVIYIWKDFKLLRGDWIRIVLSFDINGKVLEGDIMVYFRGRFI